MIRLQKDKLLETSCLGCAIRLTAFRDENDREWSSLYITWLSNHSHLWQKCWRGRFHLAWRALKGLPIEDIACESLTEIKELHKSIGEMIEHIEADSC